MHFLGASTLTSMATCHMVLDVLTHFWPVEPKFEGVLHCPFSSMSCLLMKLIHYSLPIPISKYHFLRGYIFPFPIHSIFCGKESSCFSQEAFEEFSCGKLWWFERD